MTLKFTAINHQYFLSRKLLINIYSSTFVAQVCSEVEEELVNEQLDIESSSNENTAEDALKENGGQWIPSISDTELTWSATLLDEPLKNCRIVSFYFEVKNVDRVEVSLMWRQQLGFLIGGGTVSETLLFYS